YSRVLEYEFEQYRSAWCFPMDRKHLYPGIRTTKKIGLARFLSRAHACLVGKRKAHYYFTVKGNQPSLLEGLEFYFQDRRQPHFVETTPADHGRIETRKIWTTTKLIGYLDDERLAHMRKNRDSRSVLWWIETRKIWTTTKLNGYLDFSSCGPSVRHRAAPHEQKER